MVIIQNELFQSIELLFYLRVGPDEMENINFLSYAKIWHKTLKPTNRMQIHHLKLGSEEYAKKVTFKDSTIF